LWADRFDGDTSDLFALQDEITSRIANTLGVELISAEVARLTENPDALECILRGSAASNKPRSRESIAEAIGWFERALESDPHSPEAQIRFANVLVSRTLHSISDSPAADLARADMLVDQALAASPRDANAHWIKGQVLRGQRRSEEAIPEYETALALNRNSVDAVNGLAWCKLYAGLLDEAVSFAEQAIRLSPRDPTLADRYFIIGTARLLQSRIDEAITWLEKARNARPSLPVARSRLAAAYALKGEPERAAAELAECRRLAAGDLFASIARVKAGGTWATPKTLRLFEPWFTGLRLAGMPEE
jgi:adenylate cyclase